MPKPQLLQYASTEQMQGHAIFGALALGAATAYLAAEVYVHFVSASRYDPILQVCLNGGWILGLTSLTLAVVSSCCAGRHILGTLAIVLTVISFLWDWGFPILYR